MRALREGLVDLEVGVLGDAGPEVRVQALAALGLTRTVLAVVPDFAAALAIAEASDLVALVTSSFHQAVNASRGGAGRPCSQAFPLPVPTEPVTVSQIWHPRLDADPAHRWLRGVVRAICRD